MSESPAAPTPPHDPVQLRRAVASSFLGSVIEYYDFLLYATAAAVVFDKVFFSSLEPFAATIASLGTFATGYLARPLGGVLFGHFGDLLGRKRMLLLTMTLMGVASFLIGVLPTYAQAGALAPIGLVLLRVIQGISVGGEWGGAVLMSAEHARSRRGLWASFTNAGAPCGMVLSTAALTGTGAIVGQEAFLAWGWRIPFLLSIALLAVGLFVRLKVEETPVFQAVREDGRKRVPVLDVFRKYPRVLALGVGVGLAAFVAQSTLTTFVVAYGVQEGHARQSVLNALTISSACAVVGILGWSAASDRFGRRPIVLAGALAMAVYGFLLFPLVAAGNGALLILALVIGQAVIHPMMYGPLAALYTELFSTENRYTGASLGYQLAGLGAGFAPLLFAELRRGPGTAAISWIIAGFCVLTVVCVLALKETSRQDLSGGAVPEPAS
ncbi:MFS transporter [Amycolatopsis magusensis]|uniref:MFS family permease n=1 Tax=Amycolatopsis magusensis TaxID=882444 RepID=A0ABS4PZ89_9PSEU|nr:MFS transporter [Amycolatopsis magusensis]MBP2184741.1 MFS family permease [Amycolatopsis magusensis]MDI5981616.1 MFS transporter [Amycolatopsis magusensis]